MLRGMDCIRRADTYREIIVGMHEYQHTNVTSVHKNRHTRRRFEIVAFLYALLALLRVSSDLSGTNHEICE